MWPKDDGRIGQFLLGLTISIHSLLRVLVLSERLRRQYLPWVFGVLVASVVLSRFFQLLTLLPLRLLHWTLRALSVNAQALEKAEPFFIQTSQSIPFMLMASVLYVSPKLSHKMFMLGAEEFCTRENYLVLLNSKSKIHWGSEFRDYLRRLWGRLRLGVIFLLLTSLHAWVRVVGVPILMAYRLRPIFGSVVAVVLALSAAHPTTMPWCYGFLSFFEDVRWYGRESLEAYFQLRGFKPKHRRRWLREWGWMLFGVTLGCMALGLRWKELQGAAFMLTLVVVASLVNQVMSLEEAAAKQAQDQAKVPPPTLAPTITQ